MGRRVAMSLKRQVVYDGDSGVTTPARDSERPCGSAGGSVAGGWSAETVTRLDAGTSMSTSTSTDARSGGAGRFLVVAGAVVYVAYVVVRSVLTAGVDPVVSAQGDFWVPINALG